jgi:EamA domain-containing membrane protein RarD
LIENNERNISLLTTFPTLAFVCLSLCVCVCFVNNQSLEFQSADKMPQNQFGRFFSLLLIFFCLSLLYAASKMKMNKNENNRFCWLVQCQVVVLVPLQLYTSAQREGEKKMKKNMKIVLHCIALHTR